jgi:hypothetical protein
LLSGSKSALEICCSGFGICSPASMKRFIICSLGLSLTLGDAGVWRWVTAVPDGEDVSDSQDEQEEHIFEVSA